MPVTWLKMLLLFLLGQLRRIINSALSEDVPKASIDNAIRKATSTEDMKEFVLEIMGPGKEVIFCSGC